MAEKETAPNPEAEAPEEQKVEDQPTEESPEKIRLPDGSEITAGEIKMLRDRNKDLEKGYQKKREKLNQDFDKSVDERVAARLAEMANGNAPKGPDFSKLDEYVPGLSDALSLIHADVTETKKAQAETKEVSRKYLETAETEEAWENALSAVDGKPFADTSKVRAVMEHMGMKPSSEGAEMVYYSMNGFQLGELSESSRASKAASTPAPMGGSEAPIPANFAEEAIKKSKGFPEGMPYEQRFHVATERAMKDPRAKRFQG